MKDWSLLYSSKSLAEASIIQGMLEENNIPVQMLNKLDSSYPMFGELKIYVPLYFKTMANELLNKALLN
jgi:hypothetical protein